MAKRKKINHNRIWAWLDWAEGKIPAEEIDRRAAEYEKAKRETERALQIKLP